MSGGLIHKITNDDLIANRNPKLYSDDERKYIDLISVRDSIVDPIGSFTYKIQKYPSDIDINQTIKIKNGNFKTIVNQLKRIAVNIMKAKNVYFSDFKAGVDVRYPEDRDKYILRWTIPEILLGKKVLPGNKIITLEEVLQMKSVLKLDIIVFTDGRFIETSTFFILEKLNDNGTTEFINIPANFFEMFTEELKREVLKYTKPETLKFFKAVKRMWSLARVTKDIKMLKKLEPLINSNLSLVSQINADLETLELLLDKTNDIPIEKIIQTINSIGKRLSTIIDIKLDDNMLANELQKVKDLLSNYNGDKEGIKHIFESIHDYLLNALNSETYKYLKIHKLFPINKKYLPDEKNIKSPVGNGLIFDEGHSERMSL